MSHLDATRVTIEIERLLAEYPELAEDEALRSDMIDGSTDAFAVLSEIVATMRAAATMREAIADRVKTLRERSSRYDRREEAMRVLAQRIMEAGDIRKLELPEATLSIRVVPPSLVITDEASLPDWAWRVKREPDKAAIKDRMKAGDFVPGVEMSNGGTTLSVRV